MSSPPETHSLSKKPPLQSNIYLQNNFDSTNRLPMEFEVEVLAKFESLGQGKSSRSNRTNKFNYGEKKHSAGNLLGESDFTVANKIKTREFSEKINENLQINDQINESSEDGEDLIIGDSVTIEPDMLEADETLPEKDAEPSNNKEVDELEAIESLSREVPSKQREVNYMTLKAQQLKETKLTANLSEKDLQPSPNGPVRSLNKWRPSEQRKKKKKNRGLTKEKPHKNANPAKSRSNSNVKLYKMTSQRNSTFNNNFRSRSRRESKTKLIQKKSERKQQINKLFEKYSKEDNTIEASPKKTEPPAQNFQSITPIAFSSTFGANLHQQMRETKKPKKVDPALIIEKCASFKHETQSNLFEVETLNTLTRAEDSYVAKPDYLNLNQPFLDAKVRTVLMGWMGEVSEDLWFCRDTFHMACNYVDRFLQITPNVPKDQLQLIGLTCLYIASKMEEVQMRNVNDYLSSACNIYTEEQMMGCEIEIITVLDFRLNPPTLNLWANWYMNQWDNFVMSDSFVQEHPMIKDSRIVAQFKQGNEDSYNLYREFMQYLGRDIFCVSFGCLFGEWFGFGVFEYL